MRRDHHIRNVPLQRVTEDGDCCDDQPDADRDHDHAHEVGRKRGGEAHPRRLVDEYAAARRYRNDEYEQHATDRTPLRAM